MAGLIAAALAASLLGSPHCVGMCGGLALAIGGRQWLWHLGRVTTYAALGALAGGAGQAIPGPPWVASAIAGVLLVGFAIRLAGFGSQVAAPAWLTRFGARQLKSGNRYVFGLVTGLLPCGLVYSALGLAVAGGSAPAGAAVMAAFGVGTLPALAVANRALRALLVRAPRARPLLAAGVLALGLGALAFRLPAMDAPPDDPPSCHQE